MSNYQLHCGDCLEVMRGMEDNSIDAVVTDPPYFRVKDEPWDNQWDTRQGFLSWLGVVADEWQRILKPNGSLYVFASPQMAWHVEGVIRDRFNVLNHAVWKKDGGTRANQADKEILRCYFGDSERVIFAEQGNADQVADDAAGFTAAETALKKRIFGDYLAQEFKRAGVNNHQITGAIGAYRRHNHGGAASNWLLGLNVPTPDQYQRIRDYLNSLNCAQYLEKDYEQLRQQYEQLRQQYEQLRQQYEQLRRPFNATPDAPYTDVWTFPTVGNYPGKHPCEKPLAMMEHIVNLSTRPGDLVLDCFMGSGTTGVAAVRAGRRFIGIDQAQHWADYAERRIYDASLANQGKPKHIRGKIDDFADMPLFEATT